MGKKSTRYKRIEAQIQDLTCNVKNPLSRMATISAILHHKMDNFFWTGFYILNEGELEVATYQGPLACLRLKKHTGVCWRSILDQKSVVVGNVEDFPGHIACSTLSKSEIVIPIKKEDKIVACLDIDSKKLYNFDAEDARALEAIVALIYD